MSDLNSNALITVEEFKSFSGDEVDVQINEDSVKTHVNAASQAIQKFCNRVLCPVTAVTGEKFAGDDTVTYRVKNLYMDSDTVPTLYYYTGLSWQEMTAAQYPREVDYAKGEIEFMQGHFFSKSIRYKIDYATGYASGSVPDDLKLACFDWVHRAKLRAEGKEGIASESIGEVTNSYNLASLPDSIKNVLNLYRRKVRIG
jgi:hypothetical protein